MPAKLSSIYHLDTFSTKVPVSSSTVNSVEDPYFTRAGQLQVLSDKSYHVSENADLEEHNPSKMLVSGPEKVFECTMNQESYEHQTEPVFRRPLYGQSENPTVNSRNCGTTLYQQKHSSLQGSYATKEAASPKPAVDGQTCSASDVEKQSVQNSAQCNGNQAGQTRQADSISYSHSASCSKRLKMEQTPDEDLSCPSLGTRELQSLDHHNRLPEESVEQRQYRQCLEKQRLQEKVTKIAQDSGIANLDENVYTCLSMSVKQFLRDVLCKAIRFSKKCLDLEKQQQQTIMTTNVAEKLIQIKKKEQEAAKAREKETAQTSLQESSNEKSQQESTNEKLAEEKVEDQPKKPKARKAANPKPTTSLPLRRNAGTEEMLIKWQIMAEQARLKRESQAGADASAAENTKRDIPVANTQKKTVLPTEDSGSGSSVRINKSNSTNRTGSSLKPSRLIAQKRCRSINIKNIVAVLEMDHRMNKSGLLYRLYNKIPSTNIG